MIDLEYFNILRTIVKIKGNVEELRIRLMEMKTLVSANEMTHLQAKKLKIDMEMELLNLKMMEGRIAGYTPSYNPELSHL